VKNTNTVQLFRFSFEDGRKTNISERRPGTSGVATSRSATTLSVQETAHFITRAAQPIAIGLTNCTA